MTPTPTPAPTPPPPRVVLSDSLALPAEYAYGWYFDIDATGTIDATIDYTFPDTVLLVWIAKGQCTSAMFPDCDFVASSFAGPKPRVVTAAGQTAGTYTLVLANGGPQDESFSFQVVFRAQASTSTGPAASQRLAPGAWSAPVKRD